MEFTNCTNEIKIKAKQKCISFCTATSFLVFYFVVISDIQVNCENGTEFLYILIQLPLILITYVTIA